VRPAKTFKPTERSCRETLITELLRSARFRSIVYSRYEFGAPWGVRVGSEHTTFHSVVKGNCWLRVEGVAGPVQLSAGDLVLVPRGGTQIIADSNASPIVDSISLLQNPSLHPAVLRRRGGSGPITSLICGSMPFESVVPDPLLTILPPLIYVKARQATDSVRLHTTVTELLCRLDPARSGAEAIAARLADIVFMEAVGEYFDQNLDTAEDGWLAALRDPQIGLALALLHSHPQERWTVASLSHRIAASRSILAARFSQLVGEPPLRYLKRLRMNSAAKRLLSSNLNLATIAAEAGYESAASFTKAFKSHLGMAPGEYRSKWLEKAGRPLLRPSRQSERSHKHRDRAFR